MVRNPGVPVIVLNPGLGMLVMAAFCVPVLAVLFFLPDAVSAQKAVYTVVQSGSITPGQPIPRPQGPVVLTVRGRIGVTHDHGAVQFDLPTLEQIGVIRFTTPTAWTDTPATFEGILVSRLFDLLQVAKEATAAQMIAINDYQIVIPLAEFHKWPVMMAFKRDGKYMSIREKGPLWIVYPRHAFPELNTPKQYDNWIWQLKDIVVR